MEHIAPIAAVLALVLSLITVGIGAVLKFSLSRMETALAQIELSLRGAINATAKEIDERVDKQGRDFGETVAALREYINLEIRALRKDMTDDQKFVRDTFVRRESFFKLTDALQNELRALSEKIDGKFERLEGKIESVKHLQGPAE